MKQRTSSRTIKLSKAFRTVDDETRRAIAEQRLTALEHDNYNEEEVTGDNHDDNYASDDSEAPKKKRPKKDSSAKAKGGLTGTGRASVWLNRPAKSLERVLMDNGLSADMSNKPSNSVTVNTTEEDVDEEDDFNNSTMKIGTSNNSNNYNSTNNSKVGRISYEMLQTPHLLPTVHYYSIAATCPTNLRQLRGRHFCAVCGYLGDYVCSRCGSRACSLRCQTSHQETRCLNQSL